MFGLGIDIQLVAAHINPTTGTARSLLRLYCKGRCRTAETKMGDTGNETLAHQL
jgi:hypothetical protein